jgi:hypothetical protein
MILSAKVRKKVDISVRLAEKLIFEAAATKKFTQ